MRQAWLLAVVALAGLLSCGPAAPPAARIFFDFDPSVHIDQVRLEVAVGGVALVALDVPTAAQGRVQQGQDVVVLFEDRLAGVTIDFLAAGLLSGAEVARGQASVTLAAGKTVETFLTLGATAGCPAGQHECTDACYLDDDTLHCGLSCLSCALPAHGQPTCNGGACSFNCDGSYTRCDNACVDLKRDPRNCGACAHPCDSNQLCQGGTCVLNTCSTGLHACGGTCVSNLDPATCGTRCDPCPVPSNGSATCDGTTCGISCGTGYHVCSGACASNAGPDTCGTRCTPCPAVPNTVAACNGTNCTYTCTTGFHACGNACVSDFDPATCGDNCSPCPAPPANAVVTCDGSTCGYTCNTGYHDCGGWCQVTGQGCDVCPPCGTGQYCYAPAGVCYTPGVCTENRECVSGSCQSSVCSCSMFPPTVGCRPHEQCLLQYCFDEASGT